MLKVALWYFNSRCRMSASPPLYIIMWHRKAFLSFPLPTLSFFLSMISKGKEKKDIMGMIAEKETIWMSICYSSGLFIKDRGRNRMHIKLTKGDLKSLDFIVFTHCIHAAQEGFIFMECKISTSWGGCQVSIINYFLDFSMTRIKKSCKFFNLFKFQ